MNREEVLALAVLILAIGVGVGVRTWRRVDAGEGVWIEHRLDGGASRPEASGGEAHPEVEAAALPHEALGRVDLNTADHGALVELPMIGEVRARAIVEDRRRRGAFATVDDLTRVPGIGPKTVERLRPHVQVDLRTTSLSLTANPQAPPSSHSTSPAPTPGPKPPLVDLNTAHVDALESLPGIGPVKARAIVAWRERHGRFRRVEQLLEVRGIGPATLADVRPLVTVGRGGSVGD